MPQEAIRVLCVHGVGGHPVGGSWETEWARVIRHAVGCVDETRNVAVHFAHYDDLFAAHRISAIDMVQAIGKLMWSAVTAPVRRSRGADGRLRWTAGMIVQWVENARLRTQTRARIQQRVAEVDPHVVLAHSLGSLLCYDAFADSPDSAAIIRDRIFVSLGSQIGNPFVSGQFRGGRIEPLREASHWFHLYNSADDVFTAPIRITSERYTQVDAHFNIQGFADHDALSYLGHANAVATVWARAVRGAELAPLAPRSRRALPRAAEFARPPEHRALLIGINDYPNPEDRLEGCVNDVFLMSASLQEIGFPADNIRVVLNERATAEGIRQRLDWLLDGADTGHYRFLYYSGHGAQIPAYGAAGDVDQMDESLVPFDFDWTPERSITDKYFYQLYSQLPYGCSFIATFDCCHCGGLTRSGLPRVRGLNPPDDIRHRALRWDPVTAMWTERDLTGRSPVTSGRARRDLMRESSKLSGKLGYAMGLRSLPPAQYQRLRKRQGHKGPYMPVLLYACEEQELAYEYKDGQVPYGAFTFSLTKNLRSTLLRTGRRPNFNELVRAVRRDLKRLGYEQRPTANGPKKILRARIPAFAQGGGSRSGGSRGSAARSSSARSSRRRGQTSKMLSRPGSGGLGRPANGGSGRPTGGGSGRPTSGASSRPGSRRKTS